jgi:hypothetical protein
MKSRLVCHPANQPLVMARAWQIVACDGNGCAALLLNYFEYWHTVKSEKLKNRNSINGLAKNANDKLMQYHTVEHLRRALFYMYGKDAISQGIQLLQQLGFVSIHANPLVKVDRTRHFLFHPHMVNDWIVHNTSQIRDFLADRNLERPLSEIHPSTGVFPDLENRELGDANADISKTVNAEIATKITPKRESSVAGSQDQFWTIPLPRNFEASRDALAAAARKHQRSAAEMRAAALASLAATRANDFVAIAISKLKDPDWVAPPAMTGELKPISANQDSPIKRADRELVKKILSEAKMAATEAEKAAIARRSGGKELT